MPQLTSPTPRRRRPRGMALALLPLITLVVSGCGSGRHNAQYLENSVVTGAGGSVEGLSIRNAYITRAVAKGGTAVVAFSLYADSPESATQLVSVTAAQLSGTSPGVLAVVDAGVSTPSSAVPVDYQSGPGASVASATFDDVATAVLPATYFDMVFTFADNLTQKLLVPVAQIGAVDPLSTGVPTTFPEEPFPLRTALPGEQVAASSAP